jgi:hypothetical protein
MVPIYIFGVLVVVGILAYVFFKIKWSRAEKTASRARGQQVKERDIEDKKADEKRIEEEGKNNRKT